MNLCRVISCPPIVSQYMAPKVKMSTSDTMGATTQFIDLKTRLGPHDEEQSSLKKIRLGIRHLISGTIILYL